jgi:hypothetical protein
MRRLAELASTSVYHKASARSTVPVEASNWIRSGEQESKLSAFAARIHCVTRLVTNDFIIDCMGNACPRKHNKRGQDQD